MTVAASPATRRPSQRGHVPRRLGAERRRDRGQPLRDRRRLVVDDVVDPAAAVLDRGHGGVGGILDVDERPHARAVADDGEAALADRLQLLATGPSDVPGP